MNCISSYHLFSFRFSLLLVATFAFSIVVSNAQWTQTNGPTGITINTFHDSGNALFAGSSAKGGFKSVDHGVNWQPANTGIENTEIFSFTEDEDYLYAGSLQGAYRSADIGATWTSV